MHTTTGTAKPIARRFTRSLVAIVAASFATVIIHAAGPIMPDFSTLTAGWSTDRYEPAAFENVGTFEGRDNVLGITIDETTGEFARPGGQQGLFYATQGRKYTFSPLAGPGSVLSANLYIPASWGDSANGHVRTDIWGTMVDVADVISAYPIIGFSNYGGAARFRVWDGDIGWVNLDTAVTYDAWTAFAIELLADSSINFYINGDLVYTDSTTESSVAFKEVIMQAYNFDHTDLPSAVLAPYTAHWSNNYSPISAGQCKNGGWQTLFRADDTPFINQGACVSYVNTGR